MNKSMSFSAPDLSISKKVISGAAQIAKALHNLEVKVIFGVVGIPVVEIAEEALALGIRFIAFRNEQAASYAATAYGYLTKSPGVCLIVGGPGVLHAMAGIGNSSINNWPMLLLAGSCDTRHVGKGGFQELDAISFLSPHTKFTARPSLSDLSNTIYQAYRVSLYGRAGTSFIDLPADIIEGSSNDGVRERRLILHNTAVCSSSKMIEQAAVLLKEAKAPLIVIGKGAAYARSEDSIRQLIDRIKVPFLPTPMGKGVIPDSSHLNVASARSAALRDADVVLLLGARLNWILHFGEEPKWNSSVKFIQVDISADEIGRGTNVELALVGDVELVVSQLSVALDGWSYDNSTSYAENLKLSMQRNEYKAQQKAKVDTAPMDYHSCFNVVKETLNRLSPPESGNIVYVSEGANTMDISRSIFALEYPRLRLDAGSHGTMGVGLGYAIAAHCAYNLTSREGRSAPHSSKKKIVCIEGDSAFGFSLAEVETMARYNMDILIFVLNNGGIYHGDSDEAEEWLQLQHRTREGLSGGLRSTSLGWEVGYENVATMCGGKGFLVRTPEELKEATEVGFGAKDPVVVNIMIKSGHQKKLVSHLMTAVTNGLLRPSRNSHGKGG